MHMVLYMIFHLKYILEDISCQYTNRLLVGFYPHIYLSSRQTNHNSFKPFAFDGILGGLILWLLPTMLQFKKKSCIYVILHIYIYITTYVD